MTIRENKTESWLEDIRQNDSLKALYIDIEPIMKMHGTKCILPLTPFYFNNLVEIPALATSFADVAGSSYTSIASCFYSTFSMLGAPAGVSGPPLSGIKPVVPVLYDEESVLQAINVLQGTIQFNIEKKYKDQWELIPFLLRKEIIQLVYAMAEAGKILDQFTSGMFDENVKNQSLEELYTIYSEPFDSKQVVNFKPLNILEKADLRKLAFATRVVMENINTQILYNSLELPDNFTKCIINTNMGSIGIFGTTNDTITRRYCLSVDLGGNDVYHCPAASAAIANQIRITIDCGGDDRYLNKEGLLASGILGIDALIDMEGDDYYFSDRPGISSAFMGSALLYDSAGNDVYESSSIRSMASAYFGCALLIDVCGNDIYRSISYSQGFGGTMGVGCMVDLSGDDCYEALKQTDAYFLQGSAQGRWAVASDGHSLGGGLGMLLDAEGNDRYSAKSFSQGSSYYMGMGILLDKTGDDSYNAISHSQGYAAHYSLGLMIDEEGDDLYNAVSDKSTITQIIGSGRDLSSGWFIDAKGDDTYHFGNRSFALGDMNGVGVVYDKLGSDTLQWYKNSKYENNPSIAEIIQAEEGIKQQVNPFSLVNSQGLFCRDKKTEPKLIIREP